MILKDEIDFIIKNNIMIHCPTLVEATLLLNSLHNHGLKWKSGHSYKENKSWGLYKKDTCYNLKDGAFSSLKSYTNNKYKCITLDEIMETCMVDENLMDDYLESLESQNIWIDND